MATPTYIPLASVTLAAESPQVSFTSISQDYSDLVLMIEIKGGQGKVRFNGDSSGNYNTVYTYNYTPPGTAFGSGANTNSTQFGTETGSATVANLSKMEIFDYSATDKQKSILMHNARAGGIQTVVAGRWADTDAITSITVDINSNNFAVGSSFKLFAIHGEA